MQSNVDISNALTLDVLSRLSPNFHFILVKPDSDGDETCNNNRQHDNYPTAYIDTCYLKSIAVVPHKMAKTVEKVIDQAKYQPKYQYLPD